MSQPPAANSNQPHTTLSPRQKAFVDSFLESASPHRRRKDSLPKDLRAEQTVTPIAVQASQIRDEDAANHRILHEDQLDIQAARTILDVEIAGNAITVQHYRWILKKLLDHMLANPKNVPHQLEYARIVRRLEVRLTTLIEPYSRPALRHRRLSHVEYLHKLVQDMEKGFVVMQQRGSEDEVYLVTDIQELVGHSAHLNSLASHLLTDRH